MTRRLSHVMAFDDAPFARAHRGDVAVAGVAFSGLRLEGVVRGRVRRDGRNATAVLAGLVTGSRFAAHVQLVLLEGIALAGFNVVDLGALAAAAGRPALVVCRHRPDLGAIRAALLDRVPGGRRKWRLIEQAGPMEPVRGVWIQRAGLSPGEAEAVLARLQVEGKLPEPLRVAHLIASALGC